MLIGKQKKLKKEVPFCATKATVTDIDAQHAVKTPLIVQLQT